MSKPTDKRLKYSIVEDPHMYYYLQSPQKIKDLVRSGLFKVQGSKLIDKENNKSFKIDEYVLEKVKIDTSKEDIARKQL